MFRPAAVDRSILVFNASWAGDGAGPLQDAGVGLAAIFGWTAVAAATRA